MNEERLGFARPSKNVIEVEGSVTEVLPSATFKVRLLSDERDVLAHISGRMRMNKIRLLPGDKVLMEMSPYDLTKARITRRL